MFVSYYCVWYVHDRYYCFLLRIIDYFFSLTLCTLLLGFRSVADIEIRRRTKSISTSFRRTFQTWSKTPSDDLKILSPQRSRCSSGRGRPHTRAHTHLPLSLVCRISIVWNVHFENEHLITRVADLLNRIDRTRAVLQARGKLIKIQQRLKIQ